METNVPIANLVLEILYSSRLNFTASAHVGMAVAEASPIPRIPESLKKDLRFIGPDVCSKKSCFSIIFLH